MRCLESRLMQNQHSSPCSRTATTQQQQRKHIQNRANRISLYLYCVVGVVYLIAFRGEYWCPSENPHISILMVCTIIIYRTNENTSYHNLIFEDRIIYTRRTIIYVCDTQNGTRHVQNEWVYCGLVMIIIAVVIGNRVWYCMTLSTKQLRWNQ